jgi:hypothetical protein
MKNKIASVATENSTSERNRLPLALAPKSEAAPQEDQQQQQIREIAFRLYEERGRVDGFAERDWLEAEAILRQDRKMAA